MVLLNNETFLSELVKLFANARAKNSVVMTIKRYDGRTKPLSKNAKAQRTSLTSEPTCLIRAYVPRGNKKIKKISTVIHQRDVVKFQIAYLALLKNSFDGLKKAKKMKKSKAV